MRSKSGRKYLGECVENFPGRISRGKVCGMFGGILFGGHLGLCLDCYAGFEVSVCNSSDFCHFG